MTRPIYATATPRFQPLFTGTAPSEPVGFFMLENLLTARAGSRFPTNGAGPDEDVNVYLAHLLGRILQGKCDA